MRARFSGTGLHPPPDAALLARRNIVSINPLNLIPMGRLFFLVSLHISLAACSGDHVRSNADTDPTRPRRIAALMAAFVADAAAMPLHWIYDTDAIASILEASHATSHCEFLPVSHAPFYDYPVGEFTPFGEQMAVYTHALAAAQQVDPQGIADAYNAYYTSPINETRKYVSYVDNATKGLLHNVANGKKWPHTGAGDTETNAVAHVLPVVAMRAGRPNFYRDAEAAIRVVQDNDDAVAFGMTFARILERVILGDTPDEAIKTVAKLLKVNGTGNTNDRFFAHWLEKMQEWRLRPPFDVTIGSYTSLKLHWLDQ